MKIVIFGAGSIGCYVGGKLAAIDNEVILYGRDRLKKIIDEYGLKLSHIEFEEVNVAADKLNYSTDLSCLNNAELVLLTVKSQDTEKSLLEIKPHLNPSAIVVSLQNGVSNPSMLKDILPEWKTAGGMVPYNVVNLGNGHFHCGTEGELIFEKKYETGLLKEKCITAGLPTKLTDNIQGVLWGKILLNLNNALNVLSNKPLKEQLSDRNYRRVLARCIDEARGVIENSGIEIIKVGKVPPKLIATILRLPNFAFQTIAKGMLKIDPQARSSMWEDLQGGRSTEIDYINGAVIDLATKSNLDAPINSYIVSLIKDAFSNGVSPELSGEDLLKSISDLN